MFDKIHYLATYPRQRLGKSESRLKHAFAYITE